MPTAPFEVVSPAPAPAHEGEALARITAKLRRPMPDDRLLGWLLPIAVTILGGAMRFWRITRPGGHSLTNTGPHTKGLVFDEVYYAHDSYALLHHGVETSGDGRTAGFVVHPPLGKWMMAVGELIFDHGKTVIQNKTIYPASPLAFRFMGALLGTLAILMVARIARRMFRSTALGVIAGSLLAVDGLEFVQSRIATLDIYLLFWVLAAFGCLVIDRDDGRRRLADRLTHPLAPEEWGPSLGIRPWRWAAGICMGAACATKWNGAYYILAFIALAIAWDVGARRTAGARSGLWAGVLLCGVPVFFAFVVLPAAVYVASWTGWFLSDGHYAYDHDYYVHAGQSWFGHDWAVLRGWFRYQHEIWGYDKTLHAAHPYLSKPLGWPLLERPVAYYYESPNSCGSSQCSQAILGIGNPAIWWASIPALLAALWTWVARRDWRGAAIVSVFLLGWLPWVIQELGTVHTNPACSPAGDCHRTMFLYYMLPNVPFMVLAVTMAIGLAIGHQQVSTVRRTVGITAASTYLAVCVVLFGFFYPVLSAKTITYEQWHNRIWFSHSCSTAKHRNEHHENAPCWI
jgi:dolichyl-phosphate-mannose-protein mannosyltransferase